MATFPCSGSYRAHMAGQGDHVNCPRCGELVLDTSIQTVGTVTACPACFDELLAEEPTE